VIQFITIYPVFNCSNSYKILYWLSAKGGQQNKTKVTFVGQPYANRDVVWNRHEDSIKQ